MIFVTVGTHEQQFNRLVTTIDNLKADGVLDEDVVIQTGYTRYKPRHCIYSQFYTYQQMLGYVDKARIVITHGGPSSFIMPLQIGKIPIVVPRQKKFGEHVNDHQVNFCRKVAERQRNIIVVEDIFELKKTIENYSSIISSMPKDRISNNARFCKRFERIVDDVL